MHLFGASSWIKKEKRKRFIVGERFPKERFPLYFFLECRGCQQWSSWQLSYSEIYRDVSALTEPPHCRAVPKQKAYHSYVNRSLMTALESCKSEYCLGRRKIRHSQIFFHLWVASTDQKFQWVKQSYAIQCSASTYMHWMFRMEFMGALKTWEIIMTVLLENGREEQGSMTTIWVFRQEWDRNVCSRFTMGICRDFNKRNKA